MTPEEVRFQVAVSCIQGVLEAKHGVVGELVPAVAVAESLRIADEFVKQWFGVAPSSWSPKKEQVEALDFALYKMSSYPKNKQVLLELKSELDALCNLKSSSSEQKNEKDNSPK